MFRVNCWNGVKAWRVFADGRAGSPPGDSVAAVVVTVASRGSELFGGEGDSGEHFAGIFRCGTGGVAAFLGGQSVVENGHDELCVPFQPDDGELAQGHIQPPPGGCEDQILVKKGTDRSGDLYHTALLLFAGLRYPGTENHGIKYLYYGGRAIGGAEGLGVQGTKTGVGGEDVGAAVFAAEDGSLGEYCQTAQGCRHG